MGLWTCRPHGFHYTSLPVEIYHLSHFLISSSKPRVSSFSALTPTELAGFLEGFRKPKELVE